MLERPKPCPRAAPVVPPLRGPRTCPDEERVKDKEAQKNLERATKRSNLKQMILDKLFPDPRQQLELAGGGIVKEGGVDEGPAPEAGPTPDGLPIKYNNVKKVKE